MYISFLSWLVMTGWMSLHIFLPSTIFYLLLTMCISLLLTMYITFQSWFVMTSVLRSTIDSCPQSRTMLRNPWKPHDLPSSVEDGLVSPLHRSTPIQKYLRMLCYCCSPRKVIPRNPADP